MGLSSPVPSQGCTLHPGLSARLHGAVGWRGSVALQWLCLLLIAALMQGCGFATLDRLVVEGREGGAQAGSEIHVLRAGKPVRVMPGGMLEKGDIIETGPQTSALIRFMDAGEVILRPSTRIEILNPSLRLFFGELFAKVRGAFEIQHEYGTAAAEGTEFVVGATSGGGTRLRVTVLEGHVRLSSKLGDGASVRLGPREQADVDRARPLLVRRVEPPEFNAIINWINRVTSAAGTRAARVIVPDLVGMSQAEAVQRIERERLRPGAVSPVLSLRDRVGVVLSQAPGANARVASGSRVNLAVAGRPVVVPDVRGMTLDQVRARIAGRLSLGQVSKRTVPRAVSGTVIEQSPAGGTQAAQASRVDVVVAADVATVPALIGRDYGDALGVLRANDLAVGRVERRLAERQAPGSVLEQHPRAGTLVDPGSRVSIVIAEQGVRVPEVTNLPRDEAVSRLARAGLGHAISPQRTDRFRPGTVIRQSVAAGQVVARGAQVALTVAERAPECVVPNVIGPYPQAVEVLQRQGFRVTTQGPSERTASVVGQRPGAGSRVACGATVTLITRSDSIEQDPTGDSPPTHRIIDIFRRIDPGVLIRQAPEPVE